MQHRLMRLASFAVVAFAALAVASGDATASETFSNPSPITIPTKGTATPYPSSIAVGGMNGRLTDIAVGIRGLKHDNGPDVTILLQSPQGDTAMLVSDACAGGEFVNANLTISQSVTEGLPSFQDCVSGVYVPTDYFPGHPDALPDATPGPYKADLDRFLGENPNGEWKLFVYDDQSTDGGKIEGGWNLTLQTTDTVATLPGSAASGRANPYPLTRTVSGVNGVVTDVDVSLGGVYLERAQDLDLLVVGPGGQKVMLMSDLCGLGRVKNAVWTFDDEATAPMNANFACPSFTSWKPANGFPFEVMPSPAPLSPYAPTLSVFDKSDPNGEWRLYANDDLGPDAEGFFTSTFTLNVKTRPKAKAAFEKPVVDITEGTVESVFLERPADGQDLGLGRVKVTASPLSATSGTDFRPVSTTVTFGPGQTRGVVAVEALTDELAEEPESFVLTISDPIDDADLGTQKTAEVRISDPPRPEEKPTDAGNGGATGGDGTGGASGAGGGNGGTTTTPDRTAPLVSKLKLAPASFRATRGSTVRYALSERAAVIVQVQRKKKRGRFAKKRTLRQAGRAGTNKLVLKRGSLKPGAYRVLVTATDAAGNRSVPRPRTFCVLKGGRS